MFHFQTIHLVPICNYGIGECVVLPLEGVGVNTHSPSSEWCQAPCVLQCRAVCIAGRNDGSISCKAQAVAYC